MVQIIYTIVKENELIFAQNIQFETLAEAQTALDNMHNEIKTKANIKDIAYTKNTRLTFTDTAENDSDEVHKFEII